MHENAVEKTYFISSSKSKNVLLRLAVITSTSTSSSFFLKHNKEPNKILLTSINWL